MSLTGRIRGLNRTEMYGFITPDSVIVGSQDGIKFWEDGIDVPFLTLSLGDLVEFTTEDYWSTRHNCFKKVSRDVKLIGKNAPKPPNKSLKDKIIECLDRVETVANHHEFEDLVFTLLRLIGINKIYQYDRKKGAGRADGFFMAGNLAVVYDCTLMNPYMPHKKDQIFNYKKQLRSASSITINETRASGKVLVKTFIIPEENREVWIITRGETRIIQKADNIDNICVKEVSVKSLIDVFNQKLDSQIFGELNIN